MHMYKNAMEIVDRLLIRKSLSAVLRFLTITIHFPSCSSSHHSEFAVMRLSNGFEAIECEKEEKRTGEYQLTE